jgi:hypothetical protein
MGITGYIWDAIFCSSVIALYTWFYHLKQFYYLKQTACIVLANRARRLRQQSVDDIFLLFSSYDRGVSGDSSWLVLIAGHLAYFQEGCFVMPLSA